MYNYLITCLIISAFVVTGFMLLGISVALVNQLWPDTLNNTCNHDKQHKPYNSSTK